MKLTRGLGSLALIAIGALGYMGTAQALVVTWDVSHNPSDVRLCSGGGSGCVDQYSWTHDITDNTGTPGGFLFDPSVWTVLDADVLDLPL